MTQTTQRQTDTRQLQDKFVSVLSEIDDRIAHVNTQAAKAVRRILILLMLMCIVWCANLQYA